MCTFFYNLKNPGHMCSHASTEASSGFASLCMFVSRQNHCYDLILCSRTRPFSLEVPFLRAVSLSQLSPLGEPKRKWHYVKTGGEKVCGARGMPSCLQFSCGTKFFLFVCVSFCSPDRLKLLRQLDLEKVLL